MGVKSELRVNFAQNIINTTSHGRTNNEKSSTENIGSIQKPTKCRLRQLLNIGISLAFERPLL